MKNIVFYIARFSIGDWLMGIFNNRLLFKNNRLLFSYCFLEILWGDNAWMEGHKAMMGWIPPLGKTLYWWVQLLWKKNLNKFEYWSCHHWCKTGLDVPSYFALNHMISVLLSKIKKWHITIILFCFVLLGKVYINTFKAYRYHANLPATCLTICENKAIMANN